MPWNNAAAKDKAIQVIHKAFEYESPFPDYDEVVKNNLHDKFAFAGQDKLKLGIADVDYDNIKTIFAEFAGEWKPSNGLENTVYTTNLKVNFSFPEFDAFTLYCFIRHYKPKRIIEIGSGQSTRVIIQALTKNDSTAELTCIEPYTNMNYLTGSYPKLTVIKDKLENVDIALFKSLSSGDILFIDSTHVLKPFGDVEYEYLHILPQLSSGCIVHVHDIFYPWDYPKSWIIDWRCPLTEQQLLMAFLYGNQLWKIISPCFYITQKNREIIPIKFQDYSSGSFWITIK